MDYILRPSLQHITLVKIAVELWNHDDIRVLIKKRYFVSSFEKKREIWQGIEDKVGEKVLPLLLPESLKKELLCFIKPIGLQILAWIKYHRENIYLHIKMPQEFCWTPQGTIDKKRTAQVSVKDENLDITTRYRLACIYCLEDDVRESWNQLAERKQKAIYNGGHPNFDNEHELIVFWTYDIKGELSKLNGLIKEVERQEMPPYLFAFEYAAVGGNKAATEYFLEKLTTKERCESLVKCAGYVALRPSGWGNRTDFPKIFYSDVLCFLLSQMDEEQQLEVFKSCPEYILRCFLDWPWQSCFMETAKRMWGFISVDNYYHLLMCVIDKDENNYGEYNCQNVFVEFWQQSSVNYKKYIIDACANYILLSKLLKLEDNKYINLILKDATIAEKEKLIFCEGTLYTCEKLVRSNKWDLLKVFINTFLISSGTMIKFKDEFEKRVKNYKNHPLEYAKNKDRCDTFFQLLDDFIEKNNKRRSIEDDNHPAKRLCSVELDRSTCSQNL